MNTIKRPLALIDVDGVLNPYAAAQRPDGFTEHAFFDGEEPVYVCAGHGALLRRLVPHFELMWATSWEYEANRLLAPLLDLPRLPVIEFGPRTDGYVDKLAGVIRAAGDRSVAWLDDEHSAAAHGWAAGRAAPALLVHVDPAIGLTSGDIDHMLAFAHALQSNRARAGG